MVDSLVEKLFILAQPIFYEMDLLKNKKRARAKRFLSQHLTAFSTYLLFLVFFTFFCLLYLYSLPYSFSSGDIENIRSLLNSNVQGLASIVAIVISLSLVAVQLASQTYSPRIIKMYIRNRMFWAVTAQFMLAILYNLILLNWLPINSFNPKFGDISIFITGASFLSLVPHFYSTFKQLDPETIILSLCKEVNEDYVELLTDYWHGIHVGSSLPEERNPLFTIENVLEKSDFATIRTGLGQIARKFLRLVDEKNNEMLSHHFARFYQRFGMNAINNHNDEVTSLTCQYIYQIIKSLRNKQIEIDQFDERFRSLGTRALKRKLMETTRHIIFEIRKLAKIEMQNLPNEDEIFEYIIRKGEITKTEEEDPRIKNLVILDNFRWNRLDYLEDLGKMAAELSMEEPITYSISALRELGEELLKIEMGDLMRRDLYQNILGNMADICFEGNKKHYRNHLFPVRVLIIEASIEKKKGRRDIVNILTYYFSRIYLDAVQNGICDFTIINNLGTLGRTLTPDFENETVSIVDSLGKIGTLLKDRKKEEELPLKIEEIQRNLDYVKQGLKSIKNWNNHTNTKIISKADFWLKRL